MARLAKERAKPTNAEKLTGLTEAIKGVADRAVVKAAKNKSVGQEIKGLKGEAVKLAKIDGAMRKEFALTEAKLKKISARVALKRHAGFVKNYKTKMGRLKSSLADVLDDSDKAFAQDARALSRFIEATMPEEKHQPLGASLPHRNVDYQAGPPTLGANIAPAYMAQVAELEPSSLPRTPSAADLEATIDTSFTPAIKELADKLDKDPVKIYEFVRNNMVFEPYYGSRKGAQETLWEKGGNDVDQANLLIALFRYSDIPSRYVTGVVEIPIEAAMNWVGVEKEEVAAKVFSAAGVPSKAIVSGGKISSLQIEHTWVEAYVNYGNYRGVDNDGGPKAWVALDGSFKEYEYKAPIDIQDIAGLDASSLLTTDTAALQQKLNEATATLSNWIADNMSDAKLGDIIGSKAIVKEELGLLPNSLPVPVKPISVTGEQSNLNDDQRYQLRLKTDGLDYTASLPELAGKRITVYYSPATQADADLVVQYGSLFSVPAYLIKVKPIVLVNDDAKAAGTPVTLGERQDLSLSLSNQAISDTSVKNLSVGAYYAIGLDYGHIAAEAIRARKLDLEQDLATVNETDDSVSGDEITGELLNLTSLMYFSQVDNFSNTLASLTKVAVFKEPSVAVPSYTINTASIFGVPATVRSAGADFDVIMDSYIVQAKDGDHQKAVSWTASSGYLASGGEHIIFEQMYQTKAVSTVKVLFLAVEQKVPIHQITSDNMASELALIQASPAIKEAIRNSVAQGRTVAIPERPITYHDWTGMGWVDMDPSTGAAGYYIQGGLAGGELVEAADSWINQWGLLTDLGGMLVDKISYADQYGHPQVRYRWYFSKKFTTTAFGRAFAQAFEVTSLLILPLAEALFQFLRDMHDPNLTQEQRLMRAEIVLVVMSSMVIGISMLTANPILMAVLGVAVALIWDAISDTVLDYYSGKLAALGVGQLRGYRYA